jgi:hypothetical protein
LARHALGLVDEQHHDVEDRLLEVDHLRGAGELSPQRDHLVEEQLKVVWKPIYSAFKASAILSSSNIPGRNSV